MVGLGRNIRGHRVGTLVGIPCHMMKAVAVDGDMDHRIDHRDSRMVEEVGSCVDLIFRICICHSSKDRRALVCRGMVGLCVSRS